MAHNALIYQRFALGGIIQLANVSTTDVTMYVKFFDLKDPDKEAIDPTDSTINELVINVDYSNCEIVKVDSMDYDSDTGITTVTINAAGRAMPKYGAGAGSATGSAHYINDEVACVWTHRPTEVLNRKISGTEATGANSLKVGDETDSDIYLYFQNADTNKPYIKYDKTTNQLVYANDGSSEIALGGAGTITAGDGLTLTAGDMDIDTSDTVIFVKTSSGAADKDLVPILNASGKLATGFITAGTLAAYISDVTATKDEINNALDGISANVTDTNLNTLTAGASSDASSLHKHTYTTRDYVAGEALTAGDAVSSIPYELKFYTGFNEGDIALGDSNTQRKRSLIVTPSRDVTLATAYIRGKEVNNSTLILTITVETDNGGESSGTPITNGTANTLDTSNWGASYANRTITWATPCTLVAGTTYHIVLSVNATDAANYISISVPSTISLVHPGLGGADTYDLDAGTWTGSGTEFFFWPDTQHQFGRKIYQTDSDSPLRTFGFVGIVSEDGVAEETVSVYDDVASGLTLIEGEPYYISATPGVLTTIPENGRATLDTTWTSCAYKVGEALSITELDINPGKKIVHFYGTFSSSTTNYIHCGFRPSLFRVRGSGTGGGGQSSSFGFARIAADNYDNVRYVGVAGATTDIAYCNDAGGQVMALDVSAVDEFSFALTSAETGAATLLVLGEASIE